MKSDPTVSAVIPARNSEKTLRRCLEAITKSTVKVCETIVVSDGSTDGTSEIAREFGVTLLELEGLHQANYCRNFGAENARGDFILFLDSDVVLKTDALQNALQTLSDPKIDAVVGIYSAHHPHPDIVSQYKNLWIRYSYLRSPEAVDWIFGAIAVVRKETFLNTGGFDSTLFMNKGGDLELGKRIARDRPAIRFTPNIEVEHLKHHSLFTLLKNDYERSQGFVQLALRIGQFPKSLRQGFVNVYPTFAYSAVLSWVIPAFLLLGIWSQAWFWAALVAAGLYLIFNIPFLIFFTRERRISDLPALMGIILLDHLVCGIGCLKGLLRWIIRP